DRSRQQPSRFRDPRLSGDHVRRIVDASGLEDESTRRWSGSGAGAQPVERYTGDRVDAAGVHLPHQRRYGRAGRERRGVLPCAAEGGRAGGDAHLQGRPARDRPGHAGSGARRVAAAARELAEGERFPEAMIRVDRRRAPRELLPKIARLFELSANKIRSIEETWRPEDGAPVFTADGRYCSRGWTEWTQGFQFGSALLQFDATAETEFLELGRARTIDRMSPHLTHVGDHDHGFKTVSTYGNLWRRAREHRFAASDREQRTYELALKVSGAVQAARWTRLPDGGFIHSFNGAHSLFVDTIRSLRALALAHWRGQPLRTEQDERVDLLARLVHHARATARYNVYFGRGRDRYDVRGRVAHESLFNVANGSYRGPNTQQGYSPFSTWTRGLAWAMLGFAEQIEFVETVSDEALAACGGRADVDAMLVDAARATCDRYIEIAATHGAPYWDEGAPGLANMAGWGDRDADPFNDHEPVDS